MYILFYFRYKDFRILVLAPMFRLCLQSKARSVITIQASSNLDAGDRALKCFVPCIVQVLGHKPSDIRNEAHEQSEKSQISPGYLRGYSRDDAWVGRRGAASQRCGGFL